MSGRQELRQRASGQCAAEESLRGGVGEGHGAVAAQEDDRVLEPFDSIRAGVSRASGRRLDALAESLHALREPSHVVTGSELVPEVASGETLHTASDAAEISEEHAAGPEADGDRQGERSGAECEASQERVAQGLPDQAGRHAHVNRAEGLLPEPGGEPHLVDLRGTEEHAGKLWQSRSERVVEQRAIGERLALERGVAVEQGPPARVDDRPVDGDP